jgi:hypothetical protein
LDDFTAGDYSSDYDEDMDTPFDFGFMEDEDEE